ncbi:IS110 family transposase [Leptothoe sp. PORK10 BA2]|uniref:IS110 family transposase n=1 Tax=Leptothoe sp. PORK10 BA2 TaxID=3110254 RepID=UPI002B21D7C4|nr:transposase [Leptothoe sp. PORK10 BA2]MEA5465300.1 transposase [Leptothoe sp. PORK10 BA2]
MVKIIGCDCGKDSLYVCVVDKAPRDFKSFSRSYKPKILKISHEAIDWLIEENADCYVLEPTGSYSYIWVDQLKKHGKDVRLVSPRRITAYRSYKGVNNKKDKEDAAAIAVYALENYFNSSAFIGIEQMELKEHFLALKNTINNRNPMINRLCQRLCYEVPEIVNTVEDSGRSWLNPKPPAILRFIAGEPDNPEDRHRKKRQEKVDNTIGRGISDHSKLLAEQICHLHKVEYPLEIKVDNILSDEKFAKYSKVFDEFLMGPKTRLSLTCAIYPFESFLEDGKEIVEFISSTDKSKNKRTRRNRSEGAFKLSLGMGLIFKESGTKKGWVKGGPKHARATLWTYVTTTILMNRKMKTANADIQTAVATLGNPKVSHWLNTELIKAIAALTDTTEEVAALRLHYMYLRPNEASFKRRSATASRLTRRMYKLLAKEFVQK